MAEVKTPIKGYAQADGEIVYHVGPEHTVADIARWIILHDWGEDILEFLNNPETL
jgi:hypothetical protein